MQSSVLTCAVYQILHRDKDLNFNYLSKVFLMYSKIYIKIFL